MGEIRHTSGVPVAADFRGADPPLVLDFLTGDLYSITRAGVVVKVGPGAGVGGGTTNIFQISGGDGGGDSDFAMPVPGPAGGTGSAGATGAAGPAGPPIYLLGEEIEGQPGSPGRPGLDGAAGAQGNTGAQGPTGPPIYLLAEEVEGQPGSPGRAGTDGAAGATGAQGPMGPTPHFTEIPTPDPWEVYPPEKPQTEEPIYFIRLNAARTLPNNTNENAIFNSPANGRITLPTGTYLFDMMFGVTAMSATSGNARVDILGAGTAVVNDWLWNAIGKDGTLIGVAAVQGVMPVIQETPASMFTAATTTELWAMCHGTFTVTTQGTMIPSIALVTAVATASVAIGSFFRCWRIGDTGIVSVGPWD